MSNSRQKLALFFEKRFGRSPWLLGHSDAEKHLFRFLERASAVNLPVLLYGEKGVGRGDAARLLHLMKEGNSPAFIRLDFSVISKQAALDQVLGDGPAMESGTVFFDAVDEADGPLQSRLAECLNSGALRTASNENTPQVIASARSQRSDQPSAEGGLHRSLRYELDFLSFDLPPLRHRPEDVSALSRHFLQVFRGNGGSFSEELLSAMQAYHWPGNIPELRRICALLASFSPKDLSTEDVQRLLPRFLGSMAGATSPNGYQVLQPDSHPAVRQAFRYLVRHFAERITLSSLARAVRVSPSHLSHLFKRQMKISPIAFLLRLRIEKAKNLLAQDPSLSVTEAAGRVGFGDLRHFERTFKKHVGRTPSSYRRAQAPSPPDKGLPPQD